MNTFVKRWTTPLLSAYTEFIFTQVALSYLTRKDGWLYVFDIDNTLANTWPSFSVGYANEQTRLEMLSIFVNMRAWLLHIHQSRKSKMLFLSARSFRHYLTTINWLKGNQLEAGLFNVFLVMSAKDKVQLLKKIEKFCGRIYYVDDLSYGHETGQVSFYQDVIAAVKNIGVNYLGYEEIQHIINSGESHV